MGYLQGREPLASMAYFCLTMLEDKKDRMTAARKYGIDREVLTKIAKLSSEKGGQEARKARGINRELTPSETRFLQKAIPALIRRAAEVAHDCKHDPHKSRDGIKLSEFCP